MTPASLLGPLAVETYLDTAASRLILRHAGGDLSFTIMDPTGTLKAIRPFLPGANTVEAPARPRREPPKPAPTHCLAPGCGARLVQVAPTERRGGGRKRQFCGRKCQARARLIGVRSAPPAEAPARRSRLLQRMDEQLHRGAA